MKRIICLFIATHILIGCVSSGRAGHKRIPSQDYYDSAIDVLIIDDRGNRFATYPVTSSSRLQKAYLEADEGQHYSIEIINRSDERIGIVIAVDGRNIITGKRSKLRSKERMYILDPHQRELFGGWRSGKNRINRFYFTDAGNSYSASFNDFSAMGVIGVSAFREYRSRDYRTYDNSKRRNYKSRQHSAQDSAGTGWGESEYSPSHKIEFHPEKKPFSTHLLKYEWHETLCEKRILDCDQSPRSRRNRMWDDDDRYAPPPRRRY